jgi:ABC-2 type transport system permease protein
VGRRLYSLLVKEFTQLLRDKAILFIVFYAFTGAIYVAGHGISQEILNYPLTVYDLAKTPESREMVAKLQKPYFKYITFAKTEAEFVDLLNRGIVSAALIIPPDFSRLAATDVASLQVIIDGTHPQASAIAYGYLTQIVGTYAQDVYRSRNKISEKDFSRVPGVDARIRVEYNANMTSSWFSSMLEMFNMSTMISMLLTAAAMVREREYGTMEQLIVSPMRPWELFAAKIIPSVVVVLIGLTVSIFTIVHGVFHTPIRGSLLLFLLMAALYVFTVSSLGLYLALLADNLGQAMLLLVLVTYPMLFLSGAMTPPESMSPWMQYASLISPMRYYIDFGYQVLLKGNGIAYIWRDILGILILASIIFTLAVRRYRRLFS